MDEECQTRLIFESEGNYHARAIESLTFAHEVRFRLEAELRGCAQWSNLQRTAHLSHRGTSWPGLWISESPEGRRVQVGYRLGRERR